MGSARRNDDYLSENSRQPLQAESQITGGNIQAHETTPILGPHLPCRVRPRNTFSWPGVVIGLLIGSIYCITNVYFGLKTGQISGAPIATAFFTTFISNQLQLGLGQAEIMFAVTVSTAIAIMSLAGGFVGPIPALTQLLGPEEHVDGPMKFSWLQLAIFAAALSGFGPIFAILMRDHFLVLSKRYDLPFPTATATAKVILAYDDGEGKPDKNKHQVVDSRLAPDDQIRDSDPSANAHCGQSTSDSITKARNRWAICGMCLSLIYAALVSPIPSGPNAPLFIKIAAEYSNWFDFSPGVVGQGFIIGREIVCETFLGAVFGWMVLPWLLRLQSWATGDADLGRDAVRNWALWLGLVAMLADCSFKIFWTFREALGELWQGNDKLTRPQNEALIDPSRRVDATQRVRLDSTSVKSVDTNGAVQCKDFSPKLSRLVLVGAFLALGPLCVYAVKKTVGRFVPWIETLATIFLTLPVSYISILATGKTDYTPANPLGRFSQIIDARLDSSSNQYAVIVNIAMGAIVESAACQASAMMSKLKAGETVGANPETLFWAQVSGSLVGALVASLFFRYLMSGKTTELVSKTKFKMPGAHMFLVAAKLALNDGLPKHATEGAAVIGIVFWITAALQIWFADKAWVIWIPSGTAFATGMYNFPAVTINWLTGSLIGHYWGQRGDKTAIVLFGSGLMVGEGLSQLLFGWFLSV